MCNCCNCNCNNNFGQINNNFGGGLESLGFSGHELGFGFNGLLPSERDKQKIKVLNKECERLGGPTQVTVGEITGRRVNYKDLIIHFTIKTPIDEQGEDGDEAGFTGDEYKDGFIRFNDTTAFYVALQEVAYSTQLVAIDAKTGELIEAFSQFDWTF